MKSTKLIFILIIILILSTITSASNYDYTGESITLGKNGSYPYAFSNIVSDSGSYYVLSGKNDNINAPSVYKYDNTTIYSDSQNIPFDSYRMTISNDSGVLAITDEQDKRVYFMHTGTSFANGTYFGTFTNKYLYNDCGIAYGANAKEVMYNDHYFYVWSHDNVRDDKLCIYSDYPSIAYVSSHNISSEIETGIYSIEGNALSNDRLNVLSNGVVYSYFLDGRITENSLVDSYFPNETMGERGTFINQTGLYMNSLTGTLYKHDYNGLSNETNFPYKQYNGEYYSTTQCYHSDTNCLGDTSYYLCDSTTIFNERDDCTTGGHFLETGCGLTGQTYCVSGCTTKTGYDENNDINYYYGECAPQDCTNECSAIGWECISTNARKYCDTDYDTDNCLEYSSVAYCNDNEYCSEGSCVSFDFSRSNNELVIPSFNLLYYSTDSISSNNSLDIKEGTSYIQDPFEKYTLNVQTTLSKHVQKYGYELVGDSTESFYVAMDCDYKEYDRGYNDFSEGNLSLIENFNWTGDTAIVDRGIGDYQVFITKTEDTLTGVYPLQKGNSIFSFDLDTSGGSSHDILVVYIYNSLNEAILKLGFDDVNTDDTVIKVYEINATSNPARTLFNITGVGAIESIKVKVIIDLVNDVYTLSAITNRVGGEVSTQYSAPFQIITTSLDENTKVYFHRINGKWYLDNVGLTQVGSFPTFTGQTQNALLSLCTYDEGCYTPKMYLNVESSPVYLNGENMTVCVTNTNKIVTEDDLLNLDSKEKFVAGIGLLIIIILFFALIGFSSDTTTPSLIAGSLVATGWLIVASVIGWLPSWVVILMIVLTAGIVAKALAGSVGS